MLGKPQAQSLFRQMMVSEVMSQSEDPRHVATADLGGRFAHFAIELGRLLDNQNSGVRTATFEHERCRCAGKRAVERLWTYARQRRPQTRRLTCTEIFSRRA